MLRRILKSWRALGGQKLLTAVAHWESSQPGLGPAFRWWRRVAVHLGHANDIAQCHRQQHVCRAAFQARTPADPLNISADGYVSLMLILLVSIMHVSLIKDYTYRLCGSTTTVWTKYDSTFPTLPHLLGCLSGVEECKTLSASLPCQLFSVPSAEHHYNIQWLLQAASCHAYLCTSLQRLTLVSHYSHSTWPQASP